MRFYFEFKGKKLQGTECFSYQEARFILVKILDQCMRTYKKRYDKKIYGNEELKLQHKILSKLNLVIL
jgi:hypothetical protein